MCSTGASASELTAKKTWGTVDAWQHRGALSRDVRRARHDGFVAAKTQRRLGGPEVVLECLALGHVTSIASTEASRSSAISTFISRYA
jgi:hypothetical protein